MKPMGPRYRSLLHWFPLCAVCHRDYFALAHYGLTEPPHGRAHDFVGTRKAAA